MSAAEWVFLIVGMVVGGVAAYALTVMLAELVAKIGRRWSDGK